MKLLRRIFCLHYWVEGGLVNFMNGAHEYTCSECGKCKVFTHAPVNYEGR